MICVHLCYDMDVNTSSGGIVSKGASLALQSLTSKSDLGAVDPNLFGSGALGATAQLAGCLGLRHLLLRLLWLSFHVGVLLAQDHLDVARGRHEGVDATVCPVCPSPLLLSLVHLNVLNVQVLCLQALDLSIALCILQKTQKKFTALSGPPSLTVALTLILGLS